MKTTTVYVFDMGAKTHIKVVQHPHIGSSVARYYQLNWYPVHAAEINAILIVLSASFDPCLFPGEVDAMLKDEHTLDLLHDHTVPVHRTQVSVSGIMGDGRLIRIKQTGLDFTFVTSLFDIIYILPLLFRIKTS